MLWKIPTANGCLRVSMQFINIVFCRQIFFFKSVHSVCEECLTPSALTITYEIVNTSYHDHELHCYCCVFTSLLLFILQHVSCWTPDWLPGGK